MRFQRSIRDAIFEAPMAVTLCGPRSKGSRVLCVNDAFEELTGYRFAEVVGRNLSMLQVPGDRGRAITGLARDMAECRGTTRIIRNRRRDGTIYPLLLIVRPLSPGDPDALQLGAQFGWAAAGDLDPDSLDCDPLRGLRGPGGRPVPPTAQATFRLQMTLFQTYFRVMRAYLAHREAAFASPVARRRAAPAAAEEP